MLIRFSNQGTNNNPPTPASTTKAPSISSVSGTREPSPRPICTMELSIVSMTTATTSSTTATPIASCPERSWFVPASCRILLMIADEDTISMPARKRPSVALQPSANARMRDRWYITIAPANVANSSEIPNRRILRRLNCSPIENIRNTRPIWASVSTRSTSATNAKGGVCGPTIIPATRNPTMTERPIRWHTQPTTPATTRMIAKSWIK